MVELAFKWKYANLNGVPDQRKWNLSHRRLLFHPLDGFIDQLEIPENHVLYGVAHDAVNDVIYASIPRTAPGIVATLVFFENVTETRELSPKFTAFPDYEVNEIKTCDILRSQKSRQRLASLYQRYARLDYSYDPRFDSGSFTSGLPVLRCNAFERLISTYQPVLDECGRLWVLDTGVLEFPTGNVRVKDSQLWVFDVRSGPWDADLVRRFDFPSEIVKDGTGLSGLAVDVVGGRCGETFVYIPNQVDNRIVVYDYYKDDAWFYEHYSLRGDAMESDFNYDGFRIQFTAGVTSITLGPADEGPGHFRTAYYTAGSSTGEYSVSTKSLRNPNRSPTLDHVTLVGYRGKDAQSMTHVYDEESGVLFFAESQTGRVRCWNSAKPLRPENLVTVFESKTFIYGSHISVSVTTSPKSDPD